MKFSAVLTAAVAFAPPLEENRLLVRPFINIIGGDTEYPKCPKIDTYSMGQQVQYRYGCWKNTCFSYCWALGENVGGNEWCYLATSPDDNNYKSCDKHEDCKDVCSNKCNTGCTQ